MKKFYIGDPCYVMAEEYYNQWLEKFNADDGLHELELENGKKCDFDVTGTYYGDGLYDFWNNGVIDRSKVNFIKEFPVDSGTIAVVPEDLWNKELSDEDIVAFGLIISSKNDVRPELDYQENGEINIKNKSFSEEEIEEFKSNGDYNDFVLYDIRYITIPTGPDEDEEDEEWY